ncbi:glycine--tRNA ligase subunit beta [Sporomusa acidovorans]|uniref:Glycine--tRNA ligase beta subunit n=1 Tax=Sporomusa acidovorans (strain ATCC 49682 / DSM 3132 / Mol) TaxID=1123286 RepID=A0ABZ3J4D7_SPOA4|nr:glycine--tRNA ligase subunit beta [Sporomusa acidovorans]OZC20960.1 glycine--tRNA ligase beta subunit [Sporomusa acidovorans DSM 3132]SDE62433.1 glycyl-tRNA synthetase beta chain [Sporomusa acidovorans]
MTKDLLLEIGTEEIPAKFMPDALAQLESTTKAKLTELRISYGSVRAVGTPRRLAVIAKEVGISQADKHSENKGPAVKIAFDQQGAPTKAALGFARGQGIDPAALVVKDGYVYAVVQEVGRPVAELLPGLLPDIVNSLSFPKNMRWGDLDMRFVRPIRWLVALFGNEVVPFTLPGVTSGRITRGHRFLGQAEIEVNSVEDYFERLSENFVMVDQDVRRRVIKEQIENLAVSRGGTATIDQELLEEVVYLVEYPTALCGNFEEKYLALPPEAIITPMREHQRYFPVKNKDGKLLPMFITVRNGGPEYIDIVRHGNERVLKARLADARFFFEEDRKLPLENRVEKLKTVIFQEGLGTIYDKALRLERLVAGIGQMVGASQNDLTTAQRGAHLAKADLVTGMVCEFTELQGVMGREYAKLSGERPEVAEAIFEHYLPRFAGDGLPYTMAGRLISIADKMDNIVATFSRGLIPTGSQDPYALRRQALGIVHTMINAQYHVSLTAMAGQTMDLLGITDQECRTKLTGELQEFFRLRIKNILTEEQLRYDMIDAVLAAGSDDLYDTWLRAKAIAVEGGTIAMQKAVQALVRVGNLAKNAVSETIDTNLFTAEAEHDLYKAYLEAKTIISSYQAEKNYQGVLTAVAAMAAPIDAFFGAVMVMVEEPAVKNNRLALLKAIAGLAAQTADLTKIMVM